MNFATQLTGGGLRYSRNAFNNEKRKVYYQNKNDISSVLNIMDIIEDVKLLKKNVYKAKDVISPFGIPFGSSQKVVTDVFGKPNFILSSTEIENHQVYFYKRRVTSYKYLLQIHFIDNEMVYVMNKFSTNFVYDEKELNNIGNMLIEKYTDSLNDKFISDDFSIADGDGNKIRIVTSMNLKVRYVWGNERFISKLNEQLRNDISQNVNLKKNKRSFLMSFL